MRFFRIIILLSGLVLILLTAINSYVPDNNTIKSALKFFPKTSDKVSRVRSIISEYQPHNFHSVETIHIDDIKINLDNKYNKRIYIPFHKIPRKFIFAIISQEETGVFRRKYGGYENKSQLVHLMSIWKDYIFLRSSGITYDVVKYPNECPRETLAHCFLALKVLEGAHSTNLDKLLEFYVNANIMVSEVLDLPLQVSIILLKCQKTSPLLKLPISPAS